MKYQKLNNKFSTGPQIIVINGKNDIPYIEVKTRDAYALISLYGGQLLSYKFNGCDDLLFLSEIANYSEGKAIKGGIPVCWPWFGADPENKGRQSHGFARNKMWELRSTENISDTKCKVTMGLKENNETLKLWPHSFDLEIEMAFGDSMDVLLRTTNTGDESFEITQALHTYFSVGDISKVSLQGLDKKNYLDKAKINTGEEQKYQSGDVEFAQEVDSIYQDVPKDLRLLDLHKQREIKISSFGNKTAVVWNPAAKLSQQMSDIYDDDYKKFVCVETANAADNVIEVKPGESFELSVSYKVSGL